jgi:large subunit ribosomal protein L19e
LNVSAHEELFHFQVREARKRREERIATKKQELLQSFAREEEAATQTAKK